MIVDLFAGPGGWDEGAKALGLRPVGVEMDEHACATRHAAGHLTVQAKVDELPVEPFAGKVEGLIASPPCQAFSMAGNGKGRKDVGYLHHFIDHWHRYGWADPWKLHDWSDPRTPLVLEPLRWLACNPEWVALEQVPPVLELWQHIAGVLSLDGWNVWVGVLNAADYGVPQTRRRAFLLAHKTRPVHPPEPTHAEHPEGSLFGVERWVSMADALGWGGGVQENRAHRSSSEPTPTPCFWHDAASWRWVMDRPSTTVAGDPRVSPPVHHDNGSQGKGATSSDDIRAWVQGRRSTTIVGSFRPDVAAPPGYRKAGDGPRQNQPGAVQITEAEALVLQSFPPDYPLHGNKGQRFLQVGNAVPPLLAAHILTAVRGQC